MAEAIIPARVSTNPSTSPTPVPGLEDDAALLEDEDTKSPKVEAATWGKAFKPGRLLKPGKRDPTSFVTLGRAF